MIVLTWHGTVLRIDPATATLVHGPLLPADEPDLSLELPRPLPGKLTSGALPGVVLEPGERGDIVHFSLHGQYLSARPESPALLAGTAFRGPWESFLLVDPIDAAALRCLLDHVWRTPEGLECTPILAPGFGLALGFGTVDLTERMPLAEASPASAEPSSFVLASDTGQVRLALVPGPARAEILIRPLPAHARARELQTPAQFRAEPEGNLRLGAGPETLILPVTAQDADLRWMYEKPYLGLLPRTGRYDLAPFIVRERNKFVLLARHAEGIIFDANGASTEIGYLDSFADPKLAMPDYLRREGRRIFVDREAAENATLLHGPHVVFYGGNLSNYTHWLIDAMLPLHAMLPHLPAEARLLLPPSLRAMQSNPNGACDHYAILELCGFGDMPRAEPAQTLCRVEEVYWLDDAFISDIPADTLKSLRDRVERRRPELASREGRLHIARKHSRRVANAGALSAFLVRQGFTTYFLEDLSPAAQCDLFRGAAWVIAAHGAELGNLLFCTPGTRVLELSPELDFKPYYSLMCNKLGLLHGVLPCPTSDGGFMGDMSVDMEKLRALFRMLALRL
jgi:hypothetical protein